MVRHITTQGESFDMQCLIQSFYSLPQAGNTFVPLTAVTSSTVAHLFFINHNKSVASRQAQQ